MNTLGAPRRFSENRRAAGVLPGVKVIALAEEEFLKRYPLVGNPREPYPGWEGCYFGFGSEEHAFVLSQDPERVWTVVSYGDDDSDYLLVSGLHPVNAIGHLVSVVPRGFDTLVMVELQTVDPDEGRDGPEAR